MVAAGFAASVHGLEHPAIIIKGPQLLWEATRLSAHADQAVLNGPSEQRNGDASVRDAGLIAESLVGSRRSGRRTCSVRWASHSGGNTSRASFRAASSNAWRSPVRSLTGPRWC